MAISAGFRNRIVGTVIVISTVLILLPLLLSKDMIKRETNDAIAINQNGAVVDSNGQLVHKTQADTELALNMGQEGQLRLPVNKPVNQPTSPDQMVDNSDDIIALSKPNAPSNSSSDEGELLVAKPSAPKPQPVPVQKPTSNNKDEGELLVAKPSAPKPTPPVAAPSAPSKPSTGEQVIAGSKPQERYVIQVGVFSKRANADNIIAKIKSVNLPVYAISVTRDDGSKLFRVYAGKSNNRDALKNDLAVIEKVCNVKGKVVPL